MQNPSQPVSSVTSDHPTWCDRRQHEMFVEESEGLVSAAEVSAHSRSGGNAQLLELRNPVSSVLEREGAGSWSLVAQQWLREPYTATAGYAGPPLVQLRTVVRHVGETRLDMTTGEARVLAAHLIALCDRVDLSEV